MSPGIFRNAAVEPFEIENLREQVGWDRCEGTYSEILKRHYTYYTVRDAASVLVGYTSVLSDGIADAFLLDLMVAPAFQSKGLGRRIVHRALSDLKAEGIRSVQVLFYRQLEPFYRKCGFHIIKGGVIDFSNMEWDDGKG